MHQWDFHIQDMIDFFTNANVMHLYSLDFDFHLSNWTHHEHPYIGSYLDKLTASVRNLSLENQDMRQKLRKHQHQQPHQQQRQQLQGNDNTRKNLQHNSRSPNTENDKILLEQQAELLVQELDHANRSLTSRDQCISELNEELQSKLNLVKSLSQTNQRLSHQKGISEQKLMDGFQDAATYRDLANDLTKRLQDLERHQSSIESEANLIKSEKKELQQIYTQ